MKKRKTLTASRSEFLRQQWTDPAFRSKMLDGKEAAREGAGEVGRKKPAALTARSLAMKKRWEDPIYRAAMAAKASARMTSEHKEAMTEGRRGSRKVIASLSYRGSTSLDAPPASRRHKYRLKLSRRAKRRWRKPGAREEASARATAQWADPDMRSKTHLAIIEYWDLKEKDAKRGVSRGE